MLGHGGVNPVGLLTAELVVGNNNFVGDTFVALGIIVTGIDKTVDMLLVHILSPLILEIYYIIIFNILLYFILPIDATDLDYNTKIFIIIPNYN